MRRLGVDLTGAEESCDFAAGLLASWTRRWGRSKRVRFRAGSAEHVRLLVAHGLELADGAELERGSARPAPLAWPVTGYPEPA